MWRPGYRKERLQEAWLLPLRPGESWLWATLDGAEPPWPGRGASAGGMPRAPGVEEEWRRSGEMEEEWRRRNGGVEEGGGVEEEWRRSGGVEEMEE